MVRTADGRAEVLLTPGVVLRLGENSSLRMISNRLVDTRVELLSGSAVVEADAIAKDTQVTVVCKDGTVTLPKAGLFRFDTEPAQVKVFKGEADVEVAGDTKTISSGHLLPLGGETAMVQKFDADDTDSLDRWSHRRASYLAMANASAAKTLTSPGYGYGSYSMLGSPYGFYTGNWGAAGCSSAWAFNAYYNMMTYMPCYGSLYSPYGYRYWSPYTIGYYNGYAPAIYGGGAGRTAVSSSGSAGLARPAATAGNRANSPSAAFNAGSRGGLLGRSAGNAGATASPSIRSAGGDFGGGGFSGASAGGIRGGGGGISGGGGGGMSGGGGMGGGAGSRGGGGGGAAGGRR